MRHLRWKRKYLSGFSALDRPKQTLYEDLQNLQREMEHKEHCQDMEDLMGELNVQAKSLLEVKVGSPQEIDTAVSGHTASINQTLDQQLPLAALDTPACHDCGICEHADQRIHEWIEQSTVSQEDNQDFAA